MAGDVGVLRGLILWQMCAARLAWWHAARRYQLQKSDWEEETYQFMSASWVVALLLSEAVGERMALMRWMRDLVRLHVHPRPSESLLRGERVLDERLLTWRKDRTDSPYSIIQCSICVSCIHISFNYPLRSLVERFQNNVHLWPNPRHH